MAVNTKAPRNTMQFFFWMLFAWGVSGLLFAVEKTGKSLGWDFASWSILTWIFVVTGIVTAGTLLRLGMHFLLDAWCISWEHHVNARIARAQINTIPTLQQGKEE